MQYAKSIKEIRKQKKKRRKEKKNRKGPKGTNRPSSRSGPWPSNAPPEPVPVFPLSLSDMWTPHVIIKLQPKNSPVTESEQ
jgi:hypothetical protein